MLCPDFFWGNRDTSGHFGKNSRKLGTAIYFKKSFIAEPLQEIGCPEVSRFFPTFRDTAF